MQMFFGALALLVRIYGFVLLFRAIMSWMPVSGALGKVYELAYKITEPPLAPIRNLLMRMDFLNGIPVDFSPVILFIIVNFLHGLLNTVAYSL